jgi:hypothetical protein
MTPASRSPPRRPKTDNLSKAKWPKQHRVVQQNSPRADSRRDQDAARLVVSFSSIGS